MELGQFARQQENMIATLDRIDTTTKNFATDIIDFIKDRKNWTETAAMMLYVLSDKWKANDYKKKAVFDEKQDKENLERIYQSLYFKSISYRETKITERYKATFEWIFHEPRTSEDGHGLWSSFPLWLQGESQDIYWITGKPGAGKSTLVKFISRDPRFETLLQKWATDSHLIITRFSSWTAGENRLQRSQEGLFRTLLFEAIRQRPQLVTDIFPARWFLLQSFGSIRLPDLNIDDLRIGFQNLLSATGDKMKLAILIDGLDEFDDDDRESHGDLVSLLHDTNAENGVKICVSSRPWNIFRDNYNNNPMLQLEKLSREDIKLFVREKLQLAPGYTDFCATDPHTAHKIIADIVDKSQGVFLWVSVVLGLLEDAFREGTSISNLQATVDKLPKKIDSLFYYIWDRTSKRFRAEASKYFRLKRTCQDTELFGLTIWFGDTEFPVDYKAENVTSLFLTGIIRSLRRRLMSRTGGLLELVSSNSDLDEDPKDVRVDYMHRTANDWVRDNLESINSATDPGFDPCFWFAKGEALRIVLTTKPTTSSLRSLTDWPNMLNIACLVQNDHSYRETIVTALDRLDDHLATHLLKHLGLTFDFHEEWPGLRSCTNFLELCALVPFPVCLKHWVREDPYSRTVSGRVVKNVIFGELQLGNPKARLDLLYFLIKERHYPNPEGLRRIRKAAEDELLPSTKEYATDRYMYPTQVIDMLESLISGNIQDQTLDQTRRPRSRDVIKDFFKKIIHRG
jgi:hypothetical protein